MSAPGQKGIHNSAMQISISLFQRARRPPYGCRSLFQHECARRWNARFDDAGDGCSSAPYSPRVI